MGSKMFYEHAQNLLGGVKREVGKLTLGGNIGKFNLTHIWDRVLLNTPGLKVKRHVHTVGLVNSNNSNTPCSLTLTN